MRKLLIAAAFLIFSSTNLVYAENNIGLLPTNPFYFIKEWQRGVKSFFTVSAVKRAELELAVIREKSAEIKKLQAINPSRFSANEYALDLTGRILRQAEFYLESGQKTSVVETAAVLPFSGEQWDGVIAELRPLLEKKEVAGMFFAKELEKIAPEAGQKAIGRLKENLLLRFLGRAAADLRVLELLPRESFATVEFLDDLKEYSKERTNLKNSLNQVRQGILDWAKENKKASRQEVNKLISQAEALNNQSAVILSEKAQFNLTQAKASLEALNFSDAFGQASLASAAVLKALNQSLAAEPDLASDIKELKAEYDRLSALAKDKNADLKPLFSQTEKILVKAADLLKEKAVSEHLQVLVREAKILLAEIAAQID